jgi:hypothetical protein
MTVRELDLIVLGADADAEWPVRTLLEKRHAALHIRPISCKVIRCSGHDAGVYQLAKDLLRPYVKRADYALVMLDREGSGREKQTANRIELELEKRLERNGWSSQDGGSRCAAIVLDPELEVWVWSRSPHVYTVLGLDAQTLQQLLAGFERGPEGKPRRPKEALQAALRRSGRPFSAAIFREWAEKVSLDAHERAFDKFRSTLQVWFPEETPA